jgi:hypothetical protein
VALLAGLLAVIGPTVAPASAAAAPTTTSKRVGSPGSIASIGDSISTATGTDILEADTPADSWVTGTDGSVASMRQRLGIPSGSAAMLASNGRRMRDVDDHANAMAPTNEYSVIELGGDDLCRSSVGEMTPVASCRAEGIINGFTDRTFRPDLAVDRGQSANSVFEQDT